MILSFKEVGSNITLRVNIDNIIYYQENPANPSQTILFLLGDLSLKITEKIEEVDNKLLLASIAVKDINGHLIRSV